MPHHPKPFFRTGRGWYVQLGKAQIKLCDGPKDAATEQEAWRAYHELMAAGGRPPCSAPAASAGRTDGPTVGEVFERFLDWCQRNRSPRTYEWSRKHIQKFCDSLTPSARLMPVRDLRPYHLVEWADSHDTWGPNQRRGAIVAVQRPLNWAAKLGYIEVNPVRGVEKPQPKRREHYVGPADFAELRDRYREGDAFRDLLEFLWETGCRPQEARHVEPRHLNVGLWRFEIPSEEAKGRKRWRIIRLSDRAREIVRKRLAGCNAKVFENEDGRPWTVHAVNCRFQRLRRRTNVRHFAYALRHGFCQRKLEEGHDHLTVAELLGHANGQMVATVYSHMNSADGHLLKALR